MKLYIVDLLVSRGEFFPYGNLIIWKNFWHFMFIVKPGVGIRQIMKIYFLSLLPSFVMIHSIITESYYWKRS